MKQNEQLAQSIKCQRLLGGNMSNIKQLKKGLEGSSVFFLIHPSGAPVSFYKDFTNSISEDLTVYAIQSPFLTEPYRCLNNMIEIRDIYLNYIKDIQKNGPYFIGGASFGGAAAHAIASKLLKDGEEIQLLFMIDTPGPLQKRNATITEIELFAYVFGLEINFQKMEECFFENCLEFQIEYLKNSRLYKKLRLFSLEKLITIFNVFKDNLYAQQNYKPECIPVEIVLFSATERNDFHPEYSAEAWMKYTNVGLKNINIPGTHLSINQLPRVKCIVNYLEQTLNK